MQLFDIICGNVIWQFIMEKNVMHTQKKKIELPYDPAMSLQVFPKGIKSNLSKSYHTPMFVSALFTVAKIQN